MMTTLQLPIEWGGARWMSLCLAQYCLPPLGSATRYSLLAPSPRMPASVTKWPKPLVEPKPLPMMTGLPLARQASMREKSWRFQSCSSVRAPY